MPATLTAPSTAVLDRATALVRRALTLLSTSDALVSGEIADVRAVLDRLSPATLAEADTLARRLQSADTEARQAAADHVGDPRWPLHGADDRDVAIERAAAQLLAVVRAIAGERGTAWGLQFGHLDVLTRHLDEYEVVIAAREAEAQRAALADDWLTDAALVQAAMWAVGAESAASFAPLLDVTPRAAQFWASGERQMEGPARQLCRLLVAHPELAGELRAE